MRRRKTEETDRYGPDRKTIQQFNRIRHGLSPVPPINQESTDVIAVIHHRIHPQYPAFDNKYHKQNAPLHALDSQSPSHSSTDDESRSPTPTETDFQPSPRPRSSRLFPNFPPKPSLRPPSRRSTPANRHRSSDAPWPLIILAFSVILVLIAFLTSETQ